MSGSKDDSTCDNFYDDDDVHFSDLNPPKQSKTNSRDETDEKYDIPTINKLIKAGQFKSIDYSKISVDYLGELLADMTVISRLLLSCSESS